MNKGQVIIERSLSDLQGNISKIQIACKDGEPRIPEAYEVLHKSNTGRVYTWIVKGNPQKVIDAIQMANKDTTIVDVLPLSLEEIFIYEMGGVDYEVKEIIF